MEEQNKNNRSEYYKNYMREYIKKSPKVKCDVCGNNYNKHQKYIHVKQRRHILQELLNEKKNQVLAYVETASLTV
jgi:bisphosphoglycerate-dependent phosphoglycerate mutase